MRASNAARARDLLTTGRRFVRNAVLRRARPERFIDNARTPHEEIHRDGIFAVRYYPPLTEPRVAVEGGPQLQVAVERHRVPLLMVPPLGVHTWIFDLLRERSVVRYFLARGFRVYLIDWGAPGPDDHDLSLDDYVNRFFPQAVAAVRAHSDEGELSLLGYCMGGLLSLLHAARDGDPRLRAIATIASPLDFHVGGLAGKMIGMLSVPAMAVHRWASLRLSQVGEELFHLPGWAVSLAFRATNPPGSLVAYLMMVRNLADTDYVTEYMSMGQWFSDMPYFPGGVVREVAEKFAIANQLADGRLRVGDQRIDLSRVQSDLIACAGDDDRIVDVAAARHVLDVVGSQDASFFVAPGGHAGVFAGGQAPMRVWRPIADWLAERSA